MLPYQNSILSECTFSFLTTFGKLVSVTDVIYINGYKGKEASICYAFGVSTTLQTVMKFIFNFFSFFIRESSEGIASGDRLKNRLLFAGVGFPAIFVLILKIILFTVLKWMAEASVPRI